MRQSFAVTKEELQAIVTRTEEMYSPENLTRLWERVATELKARKGLDIPPATIGARARRDGLEFQTKPSARVGKPMTAELKAKLAAARSTTRESMRDRLAKVSGADAHLARLAKNVPEQYESLIRQLKNGSRKAAMKLMCLYCVSFQRVEVQQCTGYDCPLWLFRPYQKDTDTNDNDESDT